MTTRIRIRLISRFCALTGAFLIAIPAAHADPTRLWSTYYGGDEDEGVYAVSLDSEDGVVAVGPTSSSNGIAGNAAGYTTFDSSHNGEGDGFVTRLDASGNRLWGTYVGGSEIDLLGAVDVDDDDNIIAFGSTASSSGIATLGDTTLSGPSDAMLVKLAPNGTRTWATYLGGNGSDHGNGVCVSQAGAIFVVGRTTSTSGLAVNATHQGALAGPADAFVARFEADGTLSWATYYGGSDGETEASACTVSAKEYVWVTGHTEASDGIALDGWDNTYNDEGDAFIALFDQEGTLVRGTYYGGAGYDSANGITIDEGSAGGVFIAGYTGSPNTGNAIADDGTSRTGPADAYVAKLNAYIDDRMWGTYFGGEYDDSLLAVQFDGEALVLSGYTASETGIATLDGHQTVHGGGDYDGMFVAMDASDGAPYYATYIGGDGLDMSFGVAGSFAVAAAGTGPQSSGLASVGAWDTSFSGAVDGLVSYFRMYTP